MKCIVGFFTTKPGKREAYLTAAREHLEMSRLDPDCLYIELVPMPEHPDRILLAEAFTSEEAHRRHEDTEHMRALWAVGPSLLSHVVIDNVISDQVQHIDERFD
ncbi:antibiotic biosynthesis monooxygenase family protein [Rhizobium sp. Root1220]|uniref:putative quinol monooxygenase n=1 Tax=Rhizobium sp. Root1220 TaxID=1736432 RepID=UPI0006FC324B|nr:antibiotic biosynthesis monooxygenase family protein [Rhizobium sp. Root1220]KQV81739.1 antibiotic biosynthesis monooxygenase [Rhizobium sp. Root1220]